jgi:hypothetical protein
MSSCLSQLAWKYDIWGGVGGRRELVSNIGNILRLEKPREGSCSVWGGESYRIKVITRHYNLFTESLLNRSKENVLRSVLNVILNAN